ncbi:MAG: hypothetical protein IJQ38_01790 [Bacteroidaceae bacterium]|nr:hypothetical protein [Bacteroidaceae bacterium]
MENQEQLNVAAVTADAKGIRFRVDYVESGLPRWLIEAAFVCFLLESASNWTPLMHWMEARVPLALAAVQTFGPLVMYVGLMRGMKPLYRPMTAAWWVVIALNIAGVLPYLAPELLYIIGLPLAVSLMLIYLPLGMAIAICYRGRLRWVGVCMALYILISSIVPVLSLLLFGPESGLANLPLEIPTVGIIAIYGWTMRRVLVK